MSTQSTNDIVRAWKDAIYREGLAAEELEKLAENPAGMAEIDLSELEDVSGGRPRTRFMCTAVNCTNGPKCLVNGTYTRDGAPGICE